MIFDGHSHFGYDFYYGDMPIENYIEFCNKVNISCGFVMPTPWPCTFQCGKMDVALLWNIDPDNKPIYYRYIDYEKDKNMYEILENPYSHINSININKINKLNNCNGVNLIYVPMIHPVLDSPEYIENLIQCINPIAFKVHGFSSHAFPENFNLEIVDVLKQYNIPLILHTALYHPQNVNEKHNRLWLDKCHPFLWAKFLTENNLSGVLNHGACLNNDTIELVNKSDNIKIALGPDYSLSYNYLKHDIDKEIFGRIGYLKYLKKYVDYTKLLFDIDYCWNKMETGILDFNSIDRVANIWSDEECSYIFEKNFYEIYDKLETKLKGLQMKKYK